MGIEASMNHLNPKYTGILMVVIAVGFIGWSHHMRGIAAASETWPAAPGEITASDVTHSVKQSSSSSGSKWRYRPRVEYRYELNGAEYTNDNIQFVSVSWEFKDRFKAERIIKPYPVGKAVDVYYDPLDPANSVLLKGSVGGPPWGHIIGAGIGGLGIAMALKGESGA
jgi:hypothetical protein